MKTCSYCGKQYPDEATVCVLDQQPLDVPQRPDTTPAQQAPASPPKVICPACGAKDDYTRLVGPRSSFSLSSFLLGGIFAVIFHNLGRPKRVRCNQCEARFEIHSRVSKASRVIFWLLITPTIIVLMMLLAKLVFTLFSN